MWKARVTVLILALAAPIAASIPPEAMKDFRRAEVAVEQKDWDLAIKYFEAARQASPTSAEILLRLALAHAEAGGRELPALAFFRAYLAAARNDPAAADMRRRVEDKIVELEVRIEANAGLFVRKAREAVKILTTEPEATYTYRRIASAQALLGDFVGAEDTADRMVSRLEGVVSSGASNARFGLADAFVEIIEARARAGDLAGARKLIPKIPDDGLIGREFEAADARSRIAVALAEKGDLQAAERAAAEVDRPSLKNMALAGVGRGMVDAGRLDDARRILYSLPLDVREYVHYTVMTEALRELSTAQAEAGDLDGARDTLSKISPFNIAYDYYLGLCHIALAQAKNKDFAGARRSIDLALEHAREAASDSRPDRKYLIWKDIKVAGDLIESMGADFVVAVSYSEDKKDYLNVLYARDKALWSGDLNQAEIHDWTACALYMPELIGGGLAYGSSHSDECLYRLSDIERLNAYIAGVKPDEVAYCLSYSAQSMARALDFVRQRKQYWKEAADKESGRQMK